MTITRRADFPPEIAQLFEAYNHCSDGYEMMVVIEASGQMFAAGLHNFAAAKGMTRDEMLEFAERGCRGVIESCKENWQRKKQADDIEVKIQ